MATIGQRLAQLERQGPGDEGASVWGIRTEYFDTGTGPDVVRVPTTGERLTEGEFRRRYPRAVLVVRTEYGTSEDAHVRRNAVQAR